MKAFKGGAVVVVSALVVVCLFVGMNIVYNQSAFSEGRGNLSAPLDDTFIHLQYGRQIGEGEWFRYNDGDPVSTGASSFLYAIVLGAAHFLGFGGDRLLGFAIFLGAALFVLVAFLGYKLGRTLGGERVGLWSGVLIATNGAFAWGATSGMEIALLSVLIMATLLALLLELFSGRILFAPALAALAALTRPEGQLFGIVVAGAIVFALLGDLRNDHSRSPPRSAAMLLYALLPAVVAVVQYLFSWVATGSGTQNGVLAKSLLYEPVLYPMELLDEVFNNLTQMYFALLMGLEPGNYLFPGALLLCVVGLVYLASKNVRCRIFGVASGIALALAMSAIATLVTWGWHYHRYFLPYFPPILVFAVVGIYALAARSRVAWLPEVLAGFALICSLLGLPVWAATTGGTTLQVKEQQVSLGYWIKDNLPPGARVGLNDAGAMRYYGEHPTVDLVGLTTNGLALPFRNGAGSLYEALERMPEEKRPDFFVIYPSWFPDLVAAGVLGERIAEFSLSDRPEVAGIVGASEVAVYRANWNLARSGEPFRGAGTVKDAIDIADVESEKQHDYEMQLPVIGLRPANVLSQERYPDGQIVVDAGRGVPGGEEFTGTGLSEGRSLDLVMRTTGTPFTLEVRAGDEEVGTWSFEPPGNGWYDASFTIPADFIRSDTLRVQLFPPEDAPLETHTSYHYWFVQEG